MSRALDTPLIDWAMIKDLDRAVAENTHDSLGCWNIWEVQDVSSNGPRGSYTPVLLNLGALHADGVDDVILNLAFAPQICRTRARHNG